MKRHAKASSAGSTSAIGGSRRFALVLAIAAALVLIVTPGAQAAKNVLSSFGSTSASPALGGTFSNVGGSAVNNASGNVYVVDRGNNRIEQFSAGNFVRAWGTDVVATGPGNANEMQAVAVNAGAGQFVLSFGAGGPGVSETAELAYNATAAQVQSALNAITNISTGGGSVTVSGGPGDAGANTPYLVNFNGTGLAGTNVAQMTAASGTTPLSGGSGVGANAATVTTFAEGGGAGTGFEICQVAANCKAGTAAATGGGMSSPQGIAINQVTGNVYVTDGSLLRVDEFDSQGNFIRAFGQDVVATGPHNNATGFEVCSAADVCKTGVSASTAGAIKSSFSGYPAVAPTGAPNAGNVLVADPGNFRVDEYTAAGSFVRGFGWGVLNGASALQVCTSSCQSGTSGSGAGQFASGGPTRVAVDGSGQTYAVDNGNGRVLKFNTPATGSSVFAPSQIFGIAGAIGFTAVPSEVTVDPVNDNVYVVQPASTAPNERRVLQFDSSGSLLVTHGVGAGITAVNGLGVASSTAAGGAGNIYVSTSNGQQQALVLNTGTQAAPAATIDPGSGFALAATTATLTGSVNPAGFSTGWHFEYSTDGVNWTKAPAADATLSFADSSPHPVSQVAAGLQPSTLYHARLVATKAFGAGTATSSETTFTTQAAKPVITTVNPDEIGDTTAALTARIDPSNQTTSYHFEYGAADCASNPCTSVPASGATLVAGAGSTYISQLVSGLTASTTYHFRVVAVNATGETDSPDRTLTTTAVAVKSLGPIGYELVSPPGSQDYDVSAQSVFLASGPGLAAADAKQVTNNGRCATYALGANGTLQGMNLDGGAIDFVLACRTASGWTSSAPAGDRTLCSFNGASASAGTNSEVINDVSADGSSTIFTAGGCLQSRQLLSGGFDQTPYHGAPPSEQSLFADQAVNDSVSYLSGAYDANGPIVRSDTLATRYIGGSPSLETIYFASGAGLLPGITNAPSSSYLYRRSGGVTALVSKTTTGSPLTLTDQTTTASSINNRMPGTVSADGTAVTFTLAGAMDSGDTNGVKDVYQVRDGQVIWASESAFTGPTQTAAERNFEGASANGQKIYFSTKEKLVGNGTSTGDLDTAQDIYAYDEDAPSGQELTRVSVADPSCGVTCDDNLSNTAGGNTSTAKFVTLSANGNMAFFVSGDILSAADTDAQQSLYVHNLAAGTTTYIAPVGGGSPANDNAGVDAGLTTANSLTKINGPRNGRPIRVSADGTSAAFLLTTEVNLPVGRGGSDTDGARDLFVWRSGDGLRRVRQGLAPDDNTSTVPVLGCGYNAGAHCSPVTSDGSLAFFTSTDRLAQSDTDAGFSDVYAVDPGSGRVFQISPPGAQPFDVELMFNSGSGSDVFFQTQETIDPSRDTDSQDRDMYDARVDVPVFAPVPPPPTCAVDACQGVPSPAPSSPTAGSAGFSGPGNQTPVHKKRQHKDVRKHHKKSHKRAANNNGRTH